MGEKHRERERERESILRYIAAQHAMKTQQLMSWHCSNRRGLQSTAKCITLAEEKCKPLDKLCRQWTSLFYPALRNCAPIFSSTENKIHVLGLWKASDVKASHQTNAHLSIWAALKTTSNSLLSRRAAFSAISAASSSRESSNKN